MMPFMKKFLAAASLVFLSLIAISCSGGISASHAAPTLPAPGASPNIFKKYNRSGNSAMESGWAASMDMSGVSFNSTRTATLITPRHVVMAKHFQRPNGEKVVFHNRAGKKLSRFIIQRANAQGDVAVGLLNEPVPADYHPYALPVAKASYAELIGRPVIVSDQNRRLFIHQIAQVNGGRISFKQDPAKKYGWGKNLIVGDSGNPSFVIAGKELVLVETHSTGGAGAGPFYGDPAVQASLRAAVQKLDPSYSIRTKSLR